MNRPCYIKINDIDYHTKLKSYCEENNIDVDVKYELLGFVTETAIENIANEDNLELKKLFTNDESGDYEYDAVYDEVEDSIATILDDNFSDIKESFYKRLELRGLYSRDAKDKELIETFIDKSSGRKADVITHIK